MASVSVVPASGLRDPSGNTVSVDKLPEEMNDMKIRDDKVNDMLMVVVLLFLDDIQYELHESNSIVYRKWKQLLLMVTGQRQVI